MTDYTYRLSNKKVMPSSKRIFVGLLYSTIRSQRCYVPKINWSNLIKHKRYVGNVFNSDSICEDRCYELFPISYGDDCK